MCDGFPCKADPYSSFSSPSHEKRFSNQLRLGTVPAVLQYCSSTGLAECAVRTHALHGNDPSPRQAIWPFRSGAVWNALTHTCAPALPCPELTIVTEGQGTGPSVQPHTLAPGRRAFRALWPEATGYGSKMRLECKTQTLQCVAAERYNWYCTGSTVHSKHMSGERHHMPAND